jgi:lysophospholipid hydrolase
MTQSYKEEEIDSRNLHISRTAGFDRLARRLFHRSIALVLGGGGARGIAHLGVIKVFEENEIPVDIVGGSSMGAFVGAVFSRNLDHQKTFEAVQIFARSVNKINFYMDLTFPYISLTSGFFFNTAIRSILGEGLEIGELWLDYFCNVTNLSQNGLAQVIRRGELWGPVRASMSVAGLVHPYCIGGDMLIDGCYSSNVPIGPAQALGAEIVFAIDVSNTPPFGPQKYGESLSGFGPFLKSLNPFGRAGDDRIPTYSELNERLCFATSLAEIESLKHTPGCKYLALEVPYGSTEFGKFEDIYRIGYETARMWITELKASGQLSKLAIRKGSVRDG